MNLTLKIIKLRYKIVFYNIIYSLTFTTTTHTNHKMPKKETFENLDTQDDTEIPQDTRGGINYYQELKHKKHSLKKYERLNGKDFYKMEACTWPIIIQSSKTKCHPRLRLITSPRNISIACARGERVEFPCKSHKRSAYLNWHDNDWCLPGMEY